eukprot:scaffold224466_cov33-Tisochrysis_lutea.AAC.2
MASHCNSFTALSGTFWHETTLRYTIHRRKTSCKPKRLTIYRHNLTYNSLKAATAGELAGSRHGMQSGDVADRDRHANHVFPRPRSVLNSFFAHRDAPRARKSRAHNVIFYLDVWTTCWKAGSDGNRASSSSSPKRLVEGFSKHDKPIKTLEAVDGWRFRLDSAMRFDARVKTSPVGCAEASVEAQATRAPPRKLKLTKYLGRPDRRSITEGNRDVAGAARGLSRFHWAVGALGADLLRFAHLCRKSSLLVSDGDGCFSFPCSPLIAAVLEVVAQNTSEEATVPDECDGGLRSRADEGLKLGNPVVQVPLKAGGPPLLVERVEALPVGDLRHCREQLALWPTFVTRRPHALAQQRGDDPVGLDGRNAASKGWPVAKSTLCCVNGARERRHDDGLDRTEGAVNTTKIRVQSLRLREARLVERWVDELPAPERSIVVTYTRCVRARKRSVAAAKDRGQCARHTRELEQPISLLAHTD